jgi:hypothetical protein
MSDKEHTQKSGFEADVVSESLLAAQATVKLRTRELAAMRGAARAVLMHAGFENAARAIFDYCREITGAVSGYVALLSPDGAENELLFLEAGGLPCSVDPNLPMPIRGLREQCYREQRATYHNDFMQSHWIGFMPAGHVILRNVMFAPLILEGVAVGIIGLANKNGDFDDRDAEMATAFGEMAAIALQNSRSLDERNQAQEEQERLISELTQALTQVKQLSGIIPICMSCKKIRDDEGYWEQVEVYVQNHSEADFSHGICPECLQRLYPEYADDQNT